MLKNYKVILETCKYVDRKKNLLSVFTIVFREVAVKNIVFMSNDANKLHFKMKISCVMKMQVLCNSSILTFICVDFVLKSFTINNSFELLKWLRIDFFHCK